MNQLLDRIKNKLNIQGSFLKSVSVLVGGTVFSQLLTTASLPLITRLYTPEQFSVFAVYVSMLTIFSVVCCLRFEIAIPISQDDREAVSLSLLSILSNTIFTIILFFIIAMFADSIRIWIDKEEILGYTWLLPLGVFATGLYTTFQYWATRKRQYTVIAKTNVVQSGMGIITQILSALLGFGVLGLILGQIMKSSAGTLRLAKNFLHQNMAFIREENFSQLRKVFYKNSQFPKYSVLDALANTASIHMPILIIATLSVGAEVGFLTLAMQLLAIPITFIGRSVSQVYLAEAPAKVEVGKVGEFTVNVLEHLLFIGVTVLLIIGILSPLLVKYIFGQQWADMGSIISWMIPWFTFQLISSPISMIMHIVGKQKQLLYLTLFGLFLKLCALYVQYKINPDYLVQNFAISSAIFYMIASFIFLKLAQVKWQDLQSLFMKAICFFVIIASSLGGIIHVLNINGV